MRLLAVCAGAAGIAVLIAAAFSATDSKRVVSANTTADAESYLSTGAAADSAEEGAALSESSGTDASGEAASGRASDSSADLSVNDSSAYSDEAASERMLLLSMDDTELTDALRERSVPEELIEFYQEYPQTKVFVVDYLFQPETPPSMDISGEVKKGTIPHFLQWDERWGYKTYGDTFLAISGCGPTAMSEVYSGLTGKTDMNPYEMASWADDNGYYVAGAGTAWSMMTEGAAKLGLNAWEVELGEDAILTELREGHPIICSMKPGEFTYFGHFIVLTGADDEGNITIRDSNSKEHTNRTWTADELLNQIAGLWAYSYDG